MHYNPIKCLVFQREEIMFNKTNPNFLEHEGKLYQLNGGRGFDYNFQKDTIKISNVTDTGYTATLKNKGFRDTIEDITVTVDKTADGYRLSSYKVN